MEEIREDEYGLSEVVECIIHLAWLLWACNLFPARYWVAWGSLHVSLQENVRLLLRSLNCQAPTIELLLKMPSLVVVSADAPRNPPIFLRWPSNSKRNISYERSFFLLSVCYIWCHLLKGVLYWLVNNELISLAVVVSHKYSQAIRSIHGKDYLGHNCFLCCSSSSVAHLI
jgi:hypothetical protein